MSDDTRIDIDSLTIQLAPETERTRRSGVLRPINNGLLMLTVVGLFVMVFNRNSDPYAFGIVIGSLLFNLVIAWLDRINYTALAAYLFSTWINFGVLLFCSLNLFVEQNLTNGVLFAGILALSVILSGVLISVRAAFLFAIGDSVAIFVFFEAFFRSVETPIQRSSSAEAVSLVVPLGGFLMMVALISWLFQRALAKADHRINLARQRIMHDELLRRDLAIARELQQRLYPPPPLTNANVLIASRSEPARETSGDFYDFIDLGDEKLGIVVADVTGKSIAAALVMAMARGALRSEATRNTSPAEVLRLANETICRDRSVRQMITTFYGILDTRNLTLTFSNAGHPFPILRRNGVLHEIEICGFPLGARADTIYTERHIQLEPGDQLVVLSDGVIEELNEKRELFGFDRLSETLITTDGIHPEQTLDTLWEAVREFRGSSEQNDDITIVVVQIADAAMMLVAPQEQILVER